MSTRTRFEKEAKDNSEMADYENCDGYWLSRVQHLNESFEENSTAKDHENLSTKKRKKNE